MTEGTYEADGRSMWAPIDVAPNPERNFPLRINAPDGKPVWAVNGLGQIFWRGREVETDDEARAAFLDGCKALAYIATAQGRLPVVPS